MTTEDAFAAVRAAVCSDGFRRATFAGATRFAACRWQRVTLRPVVIRGERQVQFAYFDGRKTDTKNFPDPGPPLAELLAIGFAGVHVTTAAEEIDVRVSKKGKALLGRKPATATDGELSPHNRVKDVPLPEGRADRVLEVMGILSAAGRVRPTMRAKYTQINEFLKHLAHGLGPAGLRDLGRPLAILDCGCGASYLTIAAHHYLNDVLKIPATLVGVDVNDEVIRKSVGRADKLGASGLTFACQKIGEADVMADVVIALHACDTATDDALAQAVRSRARLILSVPCCHHALNAELSAVGDAEPLRPLFRSGILRERTADLVTDAFRAAALRVVGYRAEVVEFVSPEHTARNLMIRATLAEPDPAARAEYEAMKRFWGVTPAIEHRLRLPLPTAGPPA